MTGPTPLVSVVIPVYNGSQFLDEAIRSVLDQHYPRIELIIVDDGSTDDSAERARAHDGVRVISQANAGVAAARNTGILAANGSLIAFLDQDDVWLPGKLDLQVSYLDTHPEIAYIVAGQRLSVDAGAPPPAWFAADLLANDHTGYFPGTLMARRWVFDRVGLYRPDMPPAESADWFARAKDTGLPMAILPQTVLLKRLHAANQSLEIGKVRFGVLKALKASIDRQREAQEARPLVTVIIPVHNGAAYLDEAIRSVTSQTYSPLEVIVVDDGSTDGSGEIAERLGVRCIRQPRGGTAAARNAGLRAAAGAFIAHMDADDLWERNKLTVQIAALMKDPAVDAVGVHLAEFYSPDLPEDVKQRIRAPRGPTPGHLLQSLLIRRDAHDRVGPFEPQWQVAQDMSWYMRAMESGVRLAMLPEVLVRRRLHGRNKGIVERHLGRQRLEILKAALDRRRARGDREVHEP